VKGEGRPGRGICRDDRQPAANLQFAVLKLVVLCSLVLSHYFVRILYYLPCHVHHPYPHFFHLVCADGYWWTQANSSQDGSVHRKKNVSKQHLAWTHKYSHAHTQRTFKLQKYEIQGVQ
jgi:hypothetical protein